MKNHESQAMPKPINRIADLVSTLNASLKSFL